MSAASFAPNRYPGKLIVVEGINGSGKSTQLALLAQWLKLHTSPVAFSEWDSSPLVRASKQRGIKRRMLTPATFSLLDATDFADRTERYILPMLRAGATVCADRYAHTALARDVARGMSRKWVRNLYRFTIRPNLVFYFRIPLDLALARVKGARGALEFYESGMDLGLSRDSAESFRIFQGQILDEYEDMAEDLGFHAIDATLPIVEQQRQMRSVVAKTLFQKKPDEKAAGRPAGESLGAKDTARKQRNQQHDTSGEMIESESSAGQRDG